MNAVKLISRSFRKNKRLNLINISSMALGIAATIIISGYVYQEFNYDMQHENSKQIFRVLSQNNNKEINCCGSYAPLAKGLKTDFPEIENAVRICFYYGNLSLSANDNTYYESNTIFADPDFFSMFSFPLQNGDITKCLDSPNSIMLSETAAYKYFGDADALGEQIKTSNSQIYTVTGVYKDFPKNSNFQGDIVLPLEVTSEFTQIGIEPSWNYGSEIYTFVLIDKNADSKLLSEKIRDYQFAFVEENPEYLLLQPLKSIHTEKDIYWESTLQANKSYLYFLEAVAFVILIMSAANFLLLYVGTATQRILNTGIKKFCGATKSIIFREHIKEIFIYISVSTSLSLALFYFYNNLLTVQFPFLPAISGFNSKLILFLVLLIITFAILISILPAMIISSQKPERIFKTSQQSLVGRSRLVNILVTGQFTIGVILLAVSALFFKQMIYLERYNPGFAKEELITIPMDIYNGKEMFFEKFGTFSQELKKQPGIKEVTLAFSSPADVQTSGIEYYYEGMPEGDPVHIQWNSVFFDYFETLGLKITEGRSFNLDYPDDMLHYDNGLKCAYILNQKAVRELGLDNPIEKNFEVFDRKGPIVGIIEDFNFKSLHNEIKPMCFFMHPAYYNEIIVRINPQVTNVLESIEATWKKFVSESSLEYNYITDQIDDMYKSENNLTASLNTFSAIAILIACMGLLALTILSMQKRTKEIGIRKANGAKVKEVLTMLNKDFLKWIAIAFIIACPIAWYTMDRWLENFAYKTEINWWIFALAGLVTLTIALATVSWQSWRVATKNPVEALRYE